jgi:hypothetical protein
MEGNVLEEAPRSERIEVRQAMQAPACTRGDVAALIPAAWQFVRYPTQAAFGPFETA